MHSRLLSAAWEEADANELKLSISGRKGTSRQVDCRIVYRFVFDAVHCLRTAYYHSLRSACPLSLSHAFGNNQRTETCWWLCHYIDSHGVKWFVGILWLLLIQNEERVSKIHHHMPIHTAGKCQFSSSRVGNSSIDGTGLLRTHVSIPIRWSGSSVKVYPLARSTSQLHTWCSIGWPTLPELASGSRAIMSTIAASTRKDWQSYFISPLSFIPIRWRLFRGCEWIFQRNERQLIKSSSSTRALIYIQNGFFFVVSQFGFGMTVARALRNDNRLFGERTITTNARTIERTRHLPNNSFNDAARKDIEQLLSVVLPLIYM